MFMQGIEKANPASESWHAGYFKLAIIHHVWFSVQAVLLDAQVSFVKKSTIQQLQSHFQFV